MRLQKLINQFLFIDIIKGLALTIRVFFRKPVTQRYPHEKRNPYPGFRGRHAFVRDPQTAKERCVACYKCATVCPSQCIYITYKDGEDGKRTLISYEIEALRCIYCGYCQEVCPVCAIVLTEEYEYAGYKRDDIYFDKDRLLKNWDEFVQKFSPKSYFNKFWRPAGIDIRRLPVGKREAKEITFE